MLKGTVSVIVPVYNTEQVFLERSVESVINSTYTDIELILVDDGSDKNTVDFLRCLAASDERIHIFAREHEGVVSARQYGVQKSGGRWIMFLDSDDYIEPDMIERMLLCDEDLAAECPDVIMADHISEPSLRVCREPLEIGVYDMTDKVVRRNILDKVFQAEEKPHITDSYWGKLYAKKLAEKICPMVDKRITQGEDLCFILMALAASRIVVNTGVIGYHYIPRKTSVSSTKNTHYLANLDVMYNSVKESLRELTVPDEYVYLIGKWRETILYTASTLARFLLA